MRFPTLISLALGMFLLTLNPLALSASMNKAITGKVTAKVKSTAHVPSNPLVPYKLSNELKPVLIPQSLANLLVSPANIPPQDIDFLHNISLDVSQYPDGLSLVSHFSKADEVLTALKCSDDLPVHMEALRRGYGELPISEKKDLVVKLLKRYEQASEDAVSYFDYGYAQLIYLDNQTGLFFLRKANDKLKTQFTALAYAMGQAQIDLNQEKSAPGMMTVRKLDVIHKLSDALAQDVSNHQPGFWPAYMQVIKKLTPLPAYQDFTKRDFSLGYIPYGKKLPMFQMMVDSPVEKPIQPRIEPYTLVAVNSEKSNSKDRKPKPLMSTQGIDAEWPSGIDEEPLIGSRMLPNGRHQLKFFRMKAADQIKVMIIDAQNQSLISFITQGGMEIIEDLEKDGIYELVVRQYKQAPFDPVRVYRWTGSDYKLDQALYQKFL